jgi:lupus La protein
LQIDLEAFFRGFGDLEVLRLRRTPTGLFKGSVLATYATQSSADNFLSEPQEWNGNLLETKTKTTWIQEKKDEEQKMSWDERRERDNQKDRNVRRFSAFKEMNMSKRREDKRDEKKKDGRDGQRGRRGRRDDRPRDRSASPVRVEEETEEKTEEKVVESVTPAKRAPAPEDEPPSLFSNKREKLDESAGYE